MKEWDAWSSRAQLRKDYATQMAQRITASQRAEAQRFADDYAKLMEDARLQLQRTQDIASGLRDSQGKMLDLPENLNKMRGNAWRLQEEMKAMDRGARVFPDRLNVPYQEDELLRWNMDAKKRVENLRAFVDKAKAAEQAMQSELVPAANKIRAGIDAQQAQANALSKQYDDLAARVQQRANEAKGVADDLWKNGAAMNRNTGMREWNPSLKYEVRQLAEEAQYVRPLPQKPAAVTEADIRRLQEMEAKYASTSQRLQQQGRAALDDAARIARQNAEREAAERAVELKRQQDLAAEQARRAQAAAQEQARVQQQLMEQRRVLEEQQRAQRIAQQQKEVADTARSRVQSLDNVKAQALDMNKQMDVAWRDLSRQGGVVDDAVKNWKPLNAADEAVKKAYLEQRGIKSGISRFNPFGGSAQAVPIENLPREVRESVLRGLMKQDPQGAVSSIAKNTVQNYRAGVEDDYARQVARLKQEYQAAMSACTGGTGRVLFAAGAFCDFKKVQELRSKLQAAEQRVANGMRSARSRAGQLVDDIGRSGPAQRVRSGLQQVRQSAPWQRLQQGRSQVASSFSEARNGVSKWYSSVRGGGRAAASTAVAAKEGAQVAAKTSSTLGTAAKMAGKGLMLAQAGYVGKTRFFFLNKNSDSHSSQKESNVPKILPRSEQ